MDSEKALSSATQDIKCRILARNSERFIKVYNNHTNPPPKVRFQRWLWSLVLSAAMLPVQGEVQIESTPECSTPIAVQEHIMEALSRFSERGHQAFWVEGTRLETLADALDSLIYDGLPPWRYQVERLHLIQERFLENESLAPCDAELATLSYLKALSDLSYGKLKPRELGLIWYAPELQRSREADALLELAMREPVDIEAAFSAARPELPHYQNLRQAYQLALEHLPSDWPELSAGPSLKMGDSSARVKLLRDRLAAQGYLREEPVEADLSVFDEDMDRAVRAFQRDHSLDADGVVGRRTLAELRVPPATRLAEVRANLERFRWLARDWEETMILVDIAGAGVERYRNGERVWSGKTQVGRPGRPTPRLKSFITHVTVNPTWTIPPTVLYQDIVPVVSTDLNYLQTHRIRVFNSLGGELDPTVVNWSNPTGLILRQDAGPKNALGRVAIRFPNPFTVYLHDTPSQHLFSTPQRFYSSGCVRIEGATDLAQQIFKDAGGALLEQYSASLASGNSRNVKLEVNLPVVMAYWTAQATEDGMILYRPDQYEANAQLIDLLDSSL